jgi:hypothetical protein
MTDDSATLQTARRVDRLLRSLVGILDVRSEWSASGRLRHVHVLRDTAMQDHQIVRNVVSGLEAGLGIRIDTPGIRIHSDQAAFAELASALDVAHARVTAVPIETLNGKVTAAPGVPAPAAAPRQDMQSGQQGGHDAADVGHGGNGNASAPARRNGNGPAAQAENGLGRGSYPGRLNGATPRNGNGTPPTDHTGVNGRILPVAGPQSLRVRAAGQAPAASDRIRSALDTIETAAGNAAPPSAAPNASPARSGSAAGVAIERIIVRRQTGRLHCRVVLGAGGCTYAAAAEIADAPGVEAELAARVALDALRAGGLSTARLDGVEEVAIGGTTYIVAALREPGSPATRVSAAPLIDGMAGSAVQAVLSAFHPQRGAVTRKAPGASPAGFNSATRKP